MPKEIRFRVWCEYELDGYSFSTMESEASWFLLTQTGHLMSHGPMGDFDPNAEKKYRKIAPLFWTGLKDKNGEDIYEGDIIRIQSQYETDKLIDSRARVSFSDGSFRCDFHDMILNSKVCSGSEGNWNCEVIGNTYENPELLKETPDAPQA